VGWCPIDVFSDGFDDAVRGLGWYKSYETSGCTLSEGGTLSVNLDGSANAECAYITAQAYDLTATAVSVEVPQVASANNAYSFFRLQNGVNDGVEFLAINGQLELRFEQSGSLQTLTSLGYDAAAHRWWRIREAGGMVVWETSPDGSAWTLAGQMTPILDLTAVEVVLGAGLNASQPADVTVFDNYNLPP
jgi:hypothetical protein